MRTPSILACTILTALAATAATAQEPLRSAGAETIDVELKTVPFYAVDAAGQPVYDLALEDLEISVDGAVSLADAFEVLAASFERTTAPKLLMVFSSGMESNFYFEGTYGFAPGSNGLPTYHGPAVRLEPIAGRYERSLAVLAGAGVVPIFVNPGSTRAVGSDTLRHMSQVTGGLFIDGGKLKDLESEIVAASSAYYEAGFQQPALDDPAKIEIKVRRPGVRVIFPNRLRNRQLYAALSEKQKQFVIVDLVRTGAASTQLAALHTFEGQLLRQQGKPRVAFAAAWPETFRGKEVELYDVTLDVGESEPQLVSFDRRQLAVAAEPLRVEKTLPRGKTLVWGIVAVEPASGEAYLRRLHFEPES